MTSADFENPKSVLRLGVPPIAIDILQHIDGIDFDSVWLASSEHTVDGFTARYISAEHLVANKLASGRPQDLADVAAVRQARPSRTNPESSSPLQNPIYTQRVHLPGSSTNPMAHSFHELAFTPLVKNLQQQHNSRRQYERMAQSAPSGNTLGRDETAFIALRDSFYMASVSETGWPYVQHRGGPAGFVHTLDPALLGFADLRGNKQYISLGNLQHDDRVALFFMDYPNQTRLKILGRAEVHEQDANDPESRALIDSLRTSETGALIERAILIHVEGFDWNCPQHITPRYTLEELQPALAPLQARLAALEAENAGLRSQLSSK